jgi:hypothetical protein
MTVNDLLERGRELLLLPRHKVRLLYTVPADGQRFARLFREVWKRMPLGARRAILKHWKAGSRWHRPDDGYGYPCEGFSLDAEETAEYSQGNSGARAMAQVDRDGHQLRFLWPAIKDGSDDQIRYCIAHELAHVYQFALGYADELSEEDARWLPDNPQLSYTTSSLEDDANVLVSWWGLLP